MDDAKKEALDRALTMLVDSLEQGKDFVIEQAPLVVQELIALGRAKHTACFVIAVLSAPALFFAVRSLILKGCALYDEDPRSDKEMPFYMGAALLGIGGTIAVVIGVVSNFFPMIEAWVAPRVYVLHQLKGLL